MPALASPSRRSAFLDGFTADRSGASAVMIALSMTALIGFAGLAVDVGCWYADKRTTQGAADAAAYSAAVAYGSGAASAAVTAQAKAVTAGYGMLDGAGGVSVTVHSPATSGSHSGAAGSIEVIVTKTETPYFATLFLSSASVSSRAVAISVITNQGGPACMLATNSGSGMIFSASNGIHVQLDGCGIWVDGTGSDAMDVTGGAHITTTNVSVVGGIQLKNNAHLDVTGARITGAQPQPDPYGSTQMPAVGACNQTNAAYNSGGRTYNISPGVYCGGLSVSNGVTLNMAPGVYIIKGGVFSLQSGAVNAAGGVTIILTGSAAGGYATANIGNSMNLTLTAPNTGAYAGLAFYTDPAAPASGTDTVGGGANFAVTGAMDFGPHTVNFTNGSNTATPCNQLVAGKIVLNGGIHFSYNCANTGVKEIGAAKVQNSLVE